MRIRVSEVDPTRSTLTWQKRWAGPDHGLIACWERGRAKAREDKAMASAARDGDLVILPWKGGVERATKQRTRFGTLYYLAMWQGLRGEPLDIDTEVEVTLTCSRTGMAVTFTQDRTKYMQQGDGE